MNERTNGHWYKYNYCFIWIQGRRFFCHIHRNTYVKHVVKFRLGVKLFLCECEERKIKKYFSYIARGSIKCSVCTVHVQVSLCSSGDEVCVCVSVCGLCARSSS